MKHQKGMHTVEFAIVGALLLVLVFAVIEFGRGLLVWNLLTEATRRGARLATVCPMDDPSIANVTVFNRPDSSGASPIVAGLDNSMVTTTYLDQNGNPTDVLNNVQYVRVEISGFTHHLLIPALIPGIPSAWGAPPFETTLPRESLGAVPDASGGTRTCSPP